jgi:hypothetical protein
VGGFRSAGAYLSHRATRPKHAGNQQKGFLVLESRVLSLALFAAVLIDAGNPAGAAARKAAQPAAVPSQVRAACDVAYAIAAKTPGVSIRRRIGELRDEALPQPVFGCGMTIWGSFARAKDGGDAADRLRNGFSARAWQEMLAYGADGKDGTAFAFRLKDVACLVRGQWNGGADGEPEIPGDDRYKVGVICASPVFPEDRR